MLYNCIITVAPNDELHSIIHALLVSIKGHNYGKAKDYEIWYDKLNEVVN